MSESESPNNDILLHPHAEIAEAIYSLGFQFGKEFKEDILTLIKDQNAILSEISGKLEDISASINSLSKE